jgi:glutamate racemase
MSAQPSPSSPLGVFDSGVGGLSVLKAIRRELPKETAIYVADQVHVPYGLRPLEEVQGYAEAITRYLKGKGVKLIVVACNTASAAALHHLRRTIPEIPFVGMEPAVKPAAEYTRSGVVGVLATPATFQGKLYASVVERFANNVTILQQTCPGLVAQIEAGQLTGLDTRAILKRALHPMLEQGIDTVVLGCTHYPFVIPMIEEIVGPSVRVIDPAPAVARQVRRVLSDRNLLNNTDKTTTTRFLTSGDTNSLESVLPELLEQKGRVRRVCWQTNELIECGST